jgi:chromosome segregation ATPase
MVNIKLAGDLKESHNESLKMKSLEHRLLILTQSEVTARNRIIDLEDTLKSKEKEFTESRLKSEEVETLRVDEFEYSLRVAAENLKIAQDKNQVLLDTLQNTQVSYQESVENLKGEVDRLNQRLAEYSTFVSSSDERTRTLELHISELEGQLKSSRAELDLATQSASAKIEAYKVRDIDLTSEIEELREKNKKAQDSASLYEQSLTKLRERVEELEDKFVQSENKKESMANDVYVVENELLRSKQMAQSYIEEITKLLDEKKSTERTVIKMQCEIEEIQAKYDDLESVLLKRTVDKLAKAESTIQ